MQRIGLFKSIFSSLDIGIFYRFQLYYYSNADIKALKEKEETILTIDTRGTEINNDIDFYDDSDNEMEDDPLEKTIQSKYELLISPTLQPSTKIITRRRV